MKDRWMIMSVENKHTTSDLAQMQSLPLEAKIRMTERRIRDWYEYWGWSSVCQFSGGKDSTVLKHIVDSMYSDVPAVFVNTGLEYPEIQRFVKDVKEGKYDCFNSDVEMLRPEMRFDQVIKTYGYPVISKKTASIIELARKNIAEGKNTLRLRLIRGQEINDKGQKSIFNAEKWEFMLDAPFKVSNKCCDVMKKKPLKNIKSKQEGIRSLERWRVKVNKG